LLVGVVLGVTLVVELDHVVVDGVANLAVNSHVSTIAIVLLLEVGSLGSVSNDVVRQQFPEFELEGDEPGLPCAGLHGCVILPVDVHAVEVVVDHELAEIFGAPHGVLIQSSGELSGSEGADHDLFASLVQFFAKINLDGGRGAADGVLAAEELAGLFPDISHIEASVVVAAPEGQENVVVEVVWLPIAGNSDFPSDAISVPKGDGVDIADRDGIDYLLLRRRSDRCGVDWSCATARVCGGRWGVGSGWNCGSGWCAGVATGGGAARASLQVGAFAGKHHDNDDA
jgi:hypothetical protein